MTLLPLANAAQTPRCARLDAGDRAEQLTNRWGNDLLAPDMGQSLRSPGKEAGEEADPCGCLSAHGDSVPRRGNGEQRLEAR